MSSNKVREIILWALKTYCKINDDIQTRTTSREPRASQHSNSRPSKHTRWNSQGKQLLQLGFKRKCFVSFLYKINVSRFRFYERLCFFGGSYCLRKKIFFSLFEISLMFAKICRCLKNPPNTKALVLGDIFVHCFCKNAINLYFGDISENFAKKNWNIPKRVFCCILSFNQKNTASLTLSLKINS